MSAARVGAVTAAFVPSCPANGDLHNDAALEAMLSARASTARELLIMVLGWTNGKSQINMRDEGVRFIEAQIASLRRHSVENYLVLTPQLGQQNRRAGTDNMCLNRLRPRGVCCAYSSVGMREVGVTIDRGNASWGMFTTHPYMLFLQRWWFTTHALVRGYSILSIDSDLQLSTNPFVVVHAPAYAWFDVLFQGDGGWPVRQWRVPLLERSSRAGGAARKAGAAGATSYRDGDEVGVTCTRTAHRAKPEGHPCPCDVTAAPSLNTGFVFARAAAGARAAGLFNATVQTILRRLTHAPFRDPKGVIHQGRLWPQAVMNEQVFERAGLPEWFSHARAQHEGARVHAGCHPLDVDCQPFVTPHTPDPLGVLMPRAWWVTTPRTHSVWLASEWQAGTGQACRGGFVNGFDDSSGGGGSSSSSGSSSDGGGDVDKGGGGDARARARASDEAVGTLRPLADHLIAHTEVRTGVGDASSAPVRVAVLPRPAVGRLCGVRKIPLASLHAIQSAPLPCAAFGKPSFLGMQVQHLQFMSIFTRLHIFHALRWFTSNRTAGAAEGSDARTPDCPATPQALEAALEVRLPPAARIAVLIGTAVSNVSIVCATRDDQASSRCPCCWIAPESLAKETTGCPTWNPTV